MLPYALQSLGGWRNEPCLIPITVPGLDLTGVTVRAQVRLAADTPGPAPLDLEPTNDPSAMGIRFVGVSHDANNVPTSSLVWQVPKAAMQALPYLGELGDTTMLSYALQIAGVTRMFGAFAVLASPIDSDNAPPDRVASYGRVNGGAVIAGVVLTIGDSGVTVAISGVDLLTPLVAAAQAAATSAATALARIQAGGTIEDPAKFDLSGYIASIGTADGYLIEGDPTPDAAPPVPDPTAPMAPIPLLVGIGHSMVEQGITAAVATALASANRLGVAIPTANLGRSGLTSHAIAINFEAETQLYQPIGGIIPATTTAVTLQPNVPGPLEAFGGAAGNTLGMLAGLAGTVAWPAGGPPTFTRTVAGSAVGVPAPAPYVPILYDRDVLYAYSAGQVKQRKVVDKARDGFAVLWIGRNDIFDPPTPTALALAIVRRYERIIKRLRPRNRSFVILTELPSTIETVGTRGYAQVMAINAAVLARWPRHAVDVTTPFLAADNPAGSLRNDNYLHPNAQGQALIAGVVGDAIMARGLLTDIQL